MSEETIFEAALEKATPAERAAYLDAACAGDLALRQRLDALLGAPDQAGNFLERPAIEQAAGPPPRLAPGAIRPSLPRGSLIETLSDLPGGNADGTAVE